jgi:hypothetical protein
MTNMTTLTSRMNMPRTDMAMLKDVVLRYVSRLRRDQIPLIAEDVLLAPYQWSLDRAVIGIAVQDYAWVAIEARVCAVLPEFRAVCVGVRDAVEGEDGDCEEELDYEEAVHQVGIAPVSCHEKSRHLGQLGAGTY